jgi:hypothetical protein
MRSRLFLTFVLAALFVIMSGCGTTPNCPVCGTTLNGAYTNIDVIPVPEHNPTGEPGGPFNSFDISTVAPNPAVSGHYLDYISDRIGLDIVVIDTEQDLAVNAIQGQNSVSDAGDNPSACPTIPEPGVTPPTNGPMIPPIVNVYGNFTRFGCRDDISWETTAAVASPRFHLNTGFGPSGNFGGFPGAQCCASRANGVNPMSGPDGNTTTLDGKVLFVGNGSSSVVVFDLSTMNLATNPPTPPTILATIPAGVSADYEGPTGIAGCVASWNGEAGSAYDCGDDRSDEMALASIKGADGATHTVLGVMNGDPGLPFVTFIDMTHVIAKNPADSQTLQHCLPLVPNLAYGPYPATYLPASSTYTYGGIAGYAYPLQGSGTGIPGTGVDGNGNFLPSPVLDPTVGGSFNPPSCIIGQIYYDGAGTGPVGTAPAVGLSPGVSVDTVANGFPCPDPSSVHVFSGVSGSQVDAAAGDPGFGILPTGAPYVIPCHHGPIVNYTTGAFCDQTNPAAGCLGAIAPAGLGANAWDSGTGLFLQANLNSTATTNIGAIDVIDPRVADNTCTDNGVPNQPCGPVVVGSIVTPNCMPAGIVQGPGENFLVGCGDHDGEAFPPNQYIINLSQGFSKTTGYNVNCVTAPLVNCIQINQVGGVDEVWYNPGDNKYYLAARDMPNGAVMGVIDAKTNQWLANVPTGSNSHSISVDPSNNHAFVPLQAGANCTTQSSNGCVGVYSEQ